MQKQMTDDERKQTIQKLQGIINRIEQRKKKDKGTLHDRHFLKPEKRDGAEFHQVKH